MARLEMVENGIGLIQRGDNYYLDVKFRDDGTAVAVTSASITVTYPCSSGSDTASLVTTPTTGRYDGGSEVSSSATYGEYRVSIEVSYDSKTYQFETFFYVLPWNIVQQVRAISGIKQSNDISDKDIAIIAWNAYIEAKDDCFKYIFKETIKTDGYHKIDGSNKVFYAGNMFLVDDHTVCDEEAIKGYYLTTSDEVEDLTISITDGEIGKLSIADKDGNALTGETCNVWYSYRIQSEKFREQLFKKAVVYLASHEIVLRFNELDKATLSDLQSNSPLIIASPKRMLQQYKKTLKKCKKLKVGGV